MNVAPQTGLAQKSQEAASVSDSEYREVCEFLYREAAALDGRDYSAWISMLTDDVSYYVGAPTVRAAGESAREYPIFDEGAFLLNKRIQQISNPKLTHAENPPSITRRFVTNVVVSRGAQPLEFEVASNVLLHRSYGIEAETHIYAGARNDILRRRGGALALAKRRATFDRPLVSSMNVSIPL